MAASGIDCVAAGAGDAFVDCAFATVGWADAWAIDDDAVVGGGDVDFSASTIGDGDTDAFGVGLPLASLPLGVGVAFDDLFLA